MSVWRSNIGAGFARKYNVGSEGWVGSFRSTRVMQKGTTGTQLVRPAVAVFGDGLGDHKNPQILTKSTAAVTLNTGGWTKVAVPIHPGGAEDVVWSLRAAIGARASCGGKVTVRRANLPEDHPLEVPIHPKRARVLPAPMVKNPRSETLWSSLGMIVDGVDGATPSTSRAQETAPPMPAASLSPQCCGAITCPVNICLIHFCSEEKSGEEEEGSVGNGAPGGKDVIDV
ncbi:hypothetical protein RR48_01233 [Papilio machaon]|uniref:Uncharacterized protein n=1 Tax=Papilio machaon TaxID=76193 RepID=A0A0N0PEK8_PAPMA|nr:hypothetical protein RR48_01233 [Papilio machaon]